MKKLIIAIDGPAGSGKSTAAKAVAKRFKLPYIDTGAMYRALTCLALHRGMAWTDRRGLVRLASRARIRLADGRKGSLTVLANGRDVTYEIRSPALTKNVHYMASLAGVRRAMVRLQRRLGSDGGGVIEGRDIGTVVFPEAPFKFYLDAPFKVRARRRYDELKRKGVWVCLPEVEKDLKVRDRKDLTRKVGPLRKAKDALRIDTTALTTREVVAIICRTVSSALEPRASGPACG